MELEGGRAAEQAEVAGGESRVLKLKASARKRRGGESGGREGVLLGWIGSIATNSSSERAASVGTNSTGNGLDLIYRNRSDWQWAGPTWIVFFFLTMDWIFFLDNGLDLQEPAPPLPIAPRLPQSEVRARKP